MDDRSSQYAWLQAEFDAVATAKFFVHGLRDGDTTGAGTLGADVVAAKSYCDFVRAFGGVRLFRNERSYRVEVYSSPRGLLHEELGPMWWLGRYEATRLCLAPRDCGQGQEATVWEWNYAHRWKPTTVPFAEWIQAKCNAARAKYKSAEWESIKRGPSPLTPHERRVVEARKRYTWRMIDIDNEGRVVIQIANGSDLALPFISMDLTGKLQDQEERIEGGVVVPVSHIKPGQTEIVRIECYRKLVDPRTVVLTEIPPLGPEDRDILWEFRS